MKAEAGLEGRAIGDVVLDGALVAPSAALISVFDIGLLRGYGCFETLRSYGGRAFRAGPHYRRLQASGAALGIPVPGRDDVMSWISDRARAGGDCLVRIVVTGGLDGADPGRGSRAVVFAEPIPEGPVSLSVLPTVAPWHSDGTPWELTGAKTLSYGPNLAATFAARRAGADDALLVGRSGFVLEGPTFGVGWVVDGRLETPSLDLGILASITREAVLEVAAGAGLEVAEGRFRLERLLGADEVFAISTVKEVTPVGSVGDRFFDPGPITRALGAGYRTLVTGELAD